MPEVIVADPTRTVFELACAMYKVSKCLREGGRAHPARNVPYSPHISGLVMNYVRVILTRSGAFVAHTLTPIYP